MGQFPIEYGGDVSVGVEEVARASVPLNDDRVDIRVGNVGFQPGKAEFDRRIFRRITEPVEPLPSGDVRLDASP